MGILRAAVPFARQALRAFAANANGFREDLTVRRNRIAAA
jgi:hypothetical protein